MVARQPDAGAVGVKVGDTHINMGQGTTAHLTIKRFPFLNCQM